ncbi:lysophospholipase [Melampsora larici-populina 98AG31]|uniref:Acyl-protein thioesterase 1 n=1 Tax=Melampsora larici-populina (strain 98AG31 / pathotype 3-4-7) TaxID=747676 RepID=F4RXF3_MELLP|nr:lysophospholipase [Melampsora larici-populina 98AG31]EGG02956.1 lysophospholipase [Melampsora larici-populina 98AG31]
MSSNTTKKTAVVIFSHGLGDTSRGWTFLVEQFHSRMPWIKWVLPDAPVQPVTLNGGLQMPSWFDIVALDPAAPEDQKGLLESVALINQYVQREIDNGIPPERIIVGGFSQGATIGILTGLTSPHKLAGAVSLSGFLQLADQLKQLRKPHSVSLPVFWGHGTDDPLVRYDWGQESVDFLVKTLGMKRVDFKTYQGLTHSASPKEIEDMMAWIGSKLPQTA